MGAWQGRTRENSTCLPLRQTCRTLRSWQDSRNLQFTLVCNLHLIWCIDLEWFFIWVSKVISELLWFCITSPSDWFKVLAPFFNQAEMKPKTIVAHACTFSRALCRLRVLTSSSDWFTGLSPSFWLAKEITLVLVLRHSSETRSNMDLKMWICL